MIRRGEALALILLVVMSGLTLMTIQRRAIWFDEGWTWHVARMPLEEGLLAAAHDRHPPLHPALYHFWIRVAGETEFSLRWPSVAFGLLAMALAWRLQRWIWGSPWTGGFAIVVIFLSPLWLEQMRQARMYTQLALCILLSWWSLERFLQRPAVGRWAVWTLASLSALLTHYYAIFPLTVKAALLMAARLDRQRLMGACATLAALSLGAIAWLVTGQVQPGLFLPEGHSPPLPRAFAAIGTATRSWLEAHWGALPPVGLAALLLTLLANVEPRSPSIRTRWLGLTLGSIAAPILIMAGERGDLLNFAPRHILYAHPLMGMGVAGGLARLFRGGLNRFPSPIRISMAGIVLAIGLIPVGYGARAALTLLQAEAVDGKPEEEVVRYLMEQSRPEDLILTLRAHWGIRYYWERWRPAAELREGPTAPVWDPGALDRWLRPSSPRCPGSRRVWVVGWQEEFVDPLGLFPMWLLWNGWEESSRRISGLSLREYRVPCALERPPEPEHDIPITFENGVRLLGAQFRPPHPTDRLLGVTLVWERTRSLHRPLKVFTHVYDERGSLVAQEDFPLARGFADIARWPPGQPMEIFAAIRLPEHVEPGLYPVRIGLYDPETMARVPVQRPYPGQDAWILGIFPAEILKADGPWRVLPVRKAHWEDGVTLGGVWIRPSLTVRPGQTMEVATLWDFRAGPGWTSPYVTFIHLWDEAGRLLAQDDHPILEDPGSIPGQPEGVEIVSRFHLSIPCDVKPGIYRLVIGRYLWPSVQRIRVGTSDHIALGRIEVGPPGCPMSLQGGGARR